MSELQNLLLGSAVIGKMIKTTDLNLILMITNFAGSNRDVLKMSGVLLSHPLGSGLTRNTVMWLSRDSVIRMMAKAFS